LKHNLVSNRGSTMPISNLSLPTVPAGLRVDALVLNAAELVVTARTTLTRASCRVYGQPSERVHSAYWCPTQDPPKQDRAVQASASLRMCARTGHPGTASSAMRGLAEPVNRASAGKPGGIAAGWHRGALGRPRHSPNLPGAVPV